MLFLSANVAPTRFELLLTATGTLGGSFAWLPPLIYASRLSEAGGQPFEYPLDVMWAVGRVAAMGGGHERGIVFGCIAIGCCIAAGSYCALLVNLRRALAHASTRTLIFLTGVASFEFVCLACITWVPMLITDQDTMRWTTATAFFATTIALPFCMVNAVALVDQDAVDRATRAEGLLRTRSEFTRVLSHEIR